MTDAPLPEINRIDFELKSVDMDSLITQSKRIKSKHVLFVFDSCFSGTILNRRDNIIPKNISDIVKEPVRQFITAGRENETVPDYSIFKELFIDLLEGRRDEPIPDGYITGEELGIFLKNTVPQYNSSQHPQYGKIKDPKLDKGDFVFTLAGGEPLQTGSLRVHSQPSGAKIFMDNRFKGHAPLDITGISPGEYGVLGSLSGYISQEKTVRVNSGRQAMVGLSLVPVKTKVRLFVTPKPVDAKVRIMNIPDKYYNGIELDPGRYKVEVSSFGYITKTQWVEVGTSGASFGGIDLYVELEPDQDPVWKDPITGMEFVWVPGGEFMMGSNDGSSNEKPVHKVGLDGFWMGKYEVTNGQYRQYKSSRDSKSYKDVSLNGDRQPAVYVSWDDAKGFIKWLNRKSGKTFALPTEAQWEYACRAGSTGKRFWGDSPDHACKYANVADQTAKRKWSNWSGVHNCDDGFSATAPVGSFQPNDFGLYDMLGNVWEWCQDIYAGDAYAKHGSNNPIYAQNTHCIARRASGFYLFVPVGVRDFNVFILSVIYLQVFAVLTPKYIKNTGWDFSLNPDISTVRFHESLHSTPLF